jgi:hypothetical protein
LDCEHEKFQQLDVTGDIYGLLIFVKDFYERAVFLRNNFCAREIPFELGHHPRHRKVFGWVASMGIIWQPISRTEEEIRN